MQLSVKSNILHVQFFLGDYFCRRTLYTYYTSILQSAYCLQPLTSRLIFKCSRQRSKTLFM